MRFTVVFCVVPIATSKLAQPIGSFASLESSLEWYMSFKEATVV